MLSFGLCNELEVKEQLFALIQKMLTVSTTTTQTSITTFYECRKLKMTLNATNLLASFKFIFVLVKKSFYLTF